MGFPCFVLRKKKAKGWMDDDNQKRFTGGISYFKNVCDLNLNFLCTLVMHAVLRLLILVYYAYEWK